MEEFDPLNRDPKEPGSKLDGGKPRVGLVLSDFSAALLEVSKVGTFGALKYTDHGWKSVPSGFSRYTDALYRHLLAEPSQSLDPDSGLLHAAHTAWNALARLQLILDSAEVHAPETPAQMCMRLQTRSPATYK